MADSPRKRVRSRSRSHSRSVSRSRSRGRSPSRSLSPRPRSRSRSGSRGRTDAVNPGNALYVTGLSTRVTERELEDHFSKEGKVVDCRLVVEPRTRISRGFAFVTMDTVDDADRCIKYLNQSVLEGRYITVEKKTLHQLCLQQTIKMMSSSISTLSHSLMNGQLNSFPCITSTKHSKIAN
ncbi:transformer-2 protein [Dioscorea alata]|uniref:Transformer-2 protein n=1 Tax=Dioscorea alata TaxID=55571 RepID=A0ACB7V6H8_DIOAL|nr:transformer-2 protein [Dioscorea alata]